MGQAVVDVVVDQDALGRRHRAFHRRELAGDVEAGFSPFDHPDDVPQMPLGALEPLHQVGMGGVLMHVFHAEIISPQGGYCHWMLDQRLLARRGEWSPSQAKAIARSGIPAVVRREHKCVQQFTRKHVHVLYFEPQSKTQFPEAPCPNPTHMTMVTITTMIMTTPRP